MSSLTFIASVLRTLAVLTLILTTVYAQNTTSTTLSLNVTAITGQNSSSVIQCWQLTSPLTSNSVPGVVGALDALLSNATNISYTVIPPRFDGGLHHAPIAQWVVFLSGLIHVTLPNTTAGPETEAWFTGGKYGLAFASDTANVSQFGHITKYPSDADTVTLQVPVDADPPHEVLYNGPCQWSELAGV